MKMNEIQKFKILVVEDNPATLEMVKYILETEGHEVSTAQNGEETMKLIDIHCCNTHPVTLAPNENQCFDLVIIDYDLPDITGGTLGEWIGSKYPHIALIILTGYGKLPGIQESAERMRGSVEQKPIEPDELITAANLAITLKRNQRNLPPANPVKTSTVKKILQMSHISREAANH